MNTKPAWQLEQEYHDLDGEQDALEHDLAFDRGSLKRNLEARERSLQDIEAGRFVAHATNELARLREERDEIEDEIREAQADLVRIRARRAEILALLEEARS